MPKEKREKVINVELSFLMTRKIFKVLLIYTIAVNNITDTNNKNIFCRTNKHFSKKIYIKMLQK